MLLFKIGRGIKYRIERKLLSLTTKWRITARRRRPRHQKVCMRFPHPLHRPWSQGLPVKRTSDASKDDILSKPSGRKRRLRRCKFANCDRTAKPGGFCITHGASRTSMMSTECSAMTGFASCKPGGGKKCERDGCETTAVSRRLCVAHGGGKRCKSEGCTKSAQTGGFCWCGCILSPLLSCSIDVFYSELFTWCCAGYTAEARSAGTTGASSAHKAAAHAFPTVKFKRSFMLEALCREQ